MKDQYGDNIPSDLVVLHWSYVEDIGTQKEADSLAREIDAANWYEIWRNTIDPHDRPVLAISWKVLARWQDAHGLIFDPIELEDAGIYGALDTHIISYVAHILHRFNDVDGFYHA